VKILICYASTEGQTRKIARFCADRLFDLGHAVELLPATDATDLPDCDAAILAGSVHVGRLQEALAEVATAHADRLNACPTLLLQVSLAAAGDDAEDRADLERIAGEFVRATGWTPGAVHHVAGAFRFTEYDFFKSWAMRWIAARKGQQVDPARDREYTDWAALDALMRDWSDSLVA